MFHLTHLPHQEPGEKVILFLRRHWFIAARLAAVYAVLAMVPIAVRWFLGQVDPGFLVHPVGRPVLLLAGSVYYLFWWLMLYRHFLDYYLDLWIVTDRRILNIEQNDLFNRVISEQRISRIQDVTSTQRGMAPTFLDYGEVHVQTAAEVERFVFEQVPHPHQVARQINTLVEWKRHQHLS